MSKLATCEGEVVTVDGKRSTVNYYSEEFVMSDKVETASQARSMLQAGLISERLREKVVGFRRVRTCQVVSFEDTDLAAASGEFDEVLLEATELGCVPEGFERYGTTESKVRALRTAIVRHKERKVDADELEDVESDKPKKRRSK